METSSTSVTKYCGVWTGSACSNAGGWNRLASIGNVFMVPRFIHRKDNTMKKMLGLVCALALVASAATVSVAGYGRQYYSSWSYYPTSNYYYSTYYYQPTTTYTGYQYNYCIYYQSQPSYVYYYNPYKQTYWGRLDVNGKPGAQYSLLEDKDRKQKLTDIPETAFPKPAAMPKIPESGDNVAMEPAPKPPELPEAPK